MPVVNYQEQQQLNRERDKGTPHSIAKIGAVYEDGVSLIFAGSEEESAKHYPANKSVEFAAGDRVYVTKVSGTYIVVCKI